MLQHNCTEFHCIALDIRMDIALQHIFTWVVACHIVCTYTGLKAYCGIFKESRICMFNIISILCPMLIFLERKKHESLGYAWLEVMCWHGIGEVKFWFSAVFRLMFWHVCLRNVLNCALECFNNFCTATTVCIGQQIYILPKTGSKGLKKSCCRVLKILK